MLSDAEAVEKINEVLKKYKFELPKSSFIAGGFVRDILVGDKFNDIDVWFTDKDSLTKAIKEEEWNNVNVVNTTNSYIFNLFFARNLSYIEVQYIKKTGSIEEILEGFDLTCCKVAYDPTEKKIVKRCDETDLKNKILKINNITTPASTIFRIFKFLEKGYSIENSEFEKVLKVYRNSCDISCSGFYSDKPQFKGIVNLYLDTQLDLLIASTL